MPNNNTNMITITTTFQLPMTEQEFIETMKLLGWQETVVVYEDRTAQMTVGDYKAGTLPEPNAVNVTPTVELTGTEADTDTIDVTYKVPVEKPNPTTANDFLLQLMLDRFAKPVVMPAYIQVKTRLEVEKINQIRKQIEEDLVKNTVVNVK